MTMEANNAPDDTCGNCMEKAFTALQNNRRGVLVASSLLTLIAFVERCMYPSQAIRHPSINSPLVTLFMLVGVTGMLFSLIVYSDNLHAFFQKIVNRRLGSAGKDEEGPPPYPGRGQPGDAFRDRTYANVPL